MHETTVTRPSLFHAYLTEQIGLLIENHGVAVEIGKSEEPIPIHFAYRRDINIEAGISMRNQVLLERALREVFDTPDLAAMDDAIVNGTLHVLPHEPAPLALFRAIQIDYSLHRLYHYTGTDPEHFQNFVIFTNYQFYAETFAQLCRERMAKGKSRYEAFVEPGKHHHAQCAPRRLRSDRRPAGAPASDAGLSSHRARLRRHHHDQHRHGSLECSQHHRPRRCVRAHAWLMLGHCAGLRNTQQLGDYVLAHGCVPAMRARTAAPRRAIR